MAEHEHLKDEAGLKVKLEELRNEKAETNWIVLGYEGEEKVVSLLGSGSGGVSSVVPFFVDGKVTYALLGYDTDEGNYNRLKKYVFITVCPQGVKPMRAALSSQHRVWLYNFAKPFLTLAGEFNATSASEVTERALSQKLSGSRHAEGASTTSTGGAPQGTTPTRSTTSKFTLAHSDESTAAIKAVRDDSVPTNWVAWTYEDSGEALRILGQGQGGYAEAEALLQPASVVFALLGLGVRLEGNQELYATKYLLLTWVGAEVRPLLRARSAPDRSALYAFIGQFLQLGGEWQAQERSEVSEAALVAKLSGAVLQVEKTVDPDKAKLKPTLTDGINRANLDYNPALVAGTAKPEFESDAEEKSAAEILKALRERKTNWVVFGYKGESKLISVLGSGPGGYGDIQPHFESDKAVVYAFLGLVFGSADFGGLLKYVFISFVGARAKPTAKARSAPHRTALYNWGQQFVQTAGEFPALSREEISEDLIRKKLIGTTILKEEEHSAAQSATAATGRATGVEKFEIVDEAALQKALHEVRNDSSQTNWLVIEYESEASGRLQLAQAGHGGLDTVRSLLGADKVLYIVLGTIQDQGDYSQVKYLFITWIGDSVRPLHKARSSQHRVKLYAFAKQYLQLAGEVQILSAAELSERTLVQKLTGSRMVTDAEAKTAARETKVAKGSMEKFKIENEEAVLAAIRDIGRDQSETTWVVLGYPEDGKTDYIKLHASGPGDLAAVKPYFAADKVSYAILGYKFVETIDDVEYTRQKNAFLSWVGPEVRPLHKARASQHRPAVYDYCLKVLQLHGQIHAEKSDDVTEDIINEKLTGSRKQDADKIRRETDRLREKEASARKGANVAAITPGDVAENAVILKGVEEAVNAALKSLRDDSTATNFLALGYENENSESVKMLGTGADGLEGARKFFSDAQVAYAIIGLKEPEKTEGYATLKYVFVTYIGSEVKPLHKARSAAHRLALYQHTKKFLQLAAELQALHPDDISEEILQAKIVGSRVKAD